MQLYVHNSDWLQGVLTQGIWGFFFLFSNSHQKTWKYNNREHHQIISTTERRNLDSEKSLYDFFNFEISKETKYEPNQQTREETHTNLHLYSTYP